VEFATLRLVDSEGVGKLQQLAIFVEIAAPIGVFIAGLRGQRDFKIIETGFAPLFAEGAGDDADFAVRDVFQRLFVVLIFLGPDLIAAVFPKVDPLVAVIYSAAPDRGGALGEPPVLVLRALPRFRPKAGLYEAIQDQRARTLTLDRREDLPF